MTLPNKLTMLRILLIPVMLIIYYIPWFNYTYIFYNEMGGLSVGYAVMFIIFVVASLTDFVDGYIARKYNLITTFGKFADPLADKLLVFSALAIFMCDGIKANIFNNCLEIVPLWLFLIILIREFMVSGIRMVASSEGKVIAAGKSGKAKTFVTMIAIALTFFGTTCVAMGYISYILMLVSCVLTVYSGIEYFINSKEIILKSI